MVAFDPDLLELNVALRRLRYLLDAAGIESEIETILDAWNDAADLADKSRPDLPDAMAERINRYMRPVRSQLVRMYDSTHHRERLVFSWADEDVPPREIQVRRQETVCAYWLTRSIDRALRFEAGETLVRFHRCPDCDARFVPLGIDEGSTDSGLPCSSTCREERVARASSAAGESAESEGSA